MLTYKKPTFWIVAVALVACIVAAVCFLTDPIAHAENTQPGSSQSVTDVPGPIEQWYQIAGWYNRESGEFQVEAFPDVTFRWNGGTVEAVTATTATVIIDAPSIRHVGAVDLNLDGYPEVCVTAVRSTEEHSCYVIVYDYAAGKSYTFPTDEENTGYYLYTRSNYLMCGKERLKEDETYESGRLMLTGSGDSAALTIVVTPPPAEYKGEPILWYDKTSPDSPLKAQVKLDAFPRVVFRWDHSALINDASERLVAVKRGVETELFTDGFVNAVYVADVTGDGKPDICANVYTAFSGFSSFNAVHVYDYAKGCAYVLSDAQPQNHSQNISYYLRLEDGQLLCDKVHVATGQTLATGTLAFSDGKLHLDVQVTYDFPVEYTFEGADRWNDRVTLIVRADGICDILFNPNQNDDYTSNWAHGTYEKKDGKLIMHTEDGSTYTFRFDGDNLVFVQKESSPLPGNCKLYDGAVLIADPYFD